MSDSEDTFAYVFLAVVAMSVTAITVTCCATKLDHEEAIKHNAASYVITNPETGAVEFQWKDGAK